MRTYCLIVFKRMLYNYQRRLIIVLDHVTYFCPNDRKSNSTDARFQDFSGFSSRYKSKMDIVTKKNKNTMYSIISNF